MRSQYCRQSDWMAVRFSIILSLDCMKTKEAVLRNGMLRFNFRPYLLWAEEDCFFFFFFSDKQHGLHAGFHKKMQRLELIFQAWTIRFKDRLWDEVDHNTMTNRNHSDQCLPLTEAFQFREVEYSPNSLSFYPEIISCPSCMTVFAGHSV